MLLIRGHVRRGINNNTSSPPLSLHFSTSKIYFVFFSSLWNARPSATLFSRGSLATEEKEIKLPEEGLREGDGKGRRGVSQ